MRYFLGPGRIIPSKQVLELLNTRFSDGCMLSKLRDIKWYDASLGHLELTLPLIVSPVLTNFCLGFSPNPLNASQLLPAIEALAPAYNSIVEFRVSDSVIHDPLIVDAASTLILKCNPETLRHFHIESTLSREAFVHATQLPNLESFVLEIGPDDETEHGVPLPTLTFPSLESLDIHAIHTTHSPFLGTIAGIQSKKFSKLTLEFQAAEWRTLFPPMLVSLQHSGSHQTLTSLSIKPAGHFDIDAAFIRPLLFLTQMVWLYIDVACEPLCAYKLSDEDLEELVKAMPDLKLLHLGRRPCSHPANNSIKSLVSIAKHCRHLFELQIHTNVEVVVSGVSQHGGWGGDRTSGDPPSVFAGCPVSEIVFGPCFIPNEQQGAVLFAFMLLRLFPRLNSVVVYDSISESGHLWEMVKGIINTCGHIGANVADIGKRTTSVLECEIRLCIAAVNLGN